MLKNWAFSDCGFDRMRSSSVLGGGSWRFQLVPTPPTDTSEQTSPISSCSESTYNIYIYVHCTTTGGGMGLPGPVLAPKEGSHSSHLANKVKKSAGSTEADSDESSSLLLYRGGCDHDQATFVRSAIFYKSELPIVLLQHQNDIMQT